MIRYLVALDIIRDVLDGAPVRSYEHCGMAERVAMALDDAGAFMLDESDVEAFY